jgi:hypothetical protein
VNGEPAGVHGLPDPFVQLAAVPVPGRICVKSNVTGVATPWLKEIKFGIEIFPTRGGPVKTGKLNVPPVKPVKEPVCRAGAGGGSCGGVLKVLVNIMVLAVTATPPPIFAIPVMGVAPAGRTKDSSPIADKPIKALCVIYLPLLLGDLARVLRLLAYRGREIARHTSATSIDLQTSAHGVEIQGIFTSNRDICLWLHAIHGRNTPWPIPVLP